MAISTFDLHWSQNRLIEDANGKRWERYYKAFSDSPTMDTEDTVLNDPRCPRRGNAIGSLWVESVEVTRQESSRIEYRVRVTLSDDSTLADEDPEGGGGGSQPDNPADDPPKFSADSNLVLKPFERDLSGRICANAAGDLFDPLPQRLEPNPVIVVTRFEPVFNLASLIQYSGKINSAPFLGLATNKLLCRITYQSTEVERKKIRFTGFNVTYRFEYNSEGWQPLVLNKGFNAISEGVKRAIKINGEDARNPQILNANGEWVPVTNADEALAAANFIDFRGYPEIDFNQLNIQAP